MLGNTGETMRDGEIQRATGGCLKPEFVLGDEIESRQATNVILEECAIHVIEKHVCGGCWHEWSRIERQKPGRRYICEAGAL